MSNRALYDASFIDFLTEDNSSIVGKMCSSIQGENLSTTIESWESEISILKYVLSFLDNEIGRASCRERV